MSTQVSWVDYKISDVFTYYNMDGLTWDDVNDTKAISDWAQCFNCTLEDHASFAMFGFLGTTDATKKLSFNSRGGEACWISLRVPVGVVQVKFKNSSGSSSKIADVSNGTIVLGAGSEHSYQLNNVCYSEVSLGYSPYKWNGEAYLDNCVNFTTVTASPAKGPEYSGELLTWHTYLIDGKSIRAQGYPPTSSSSHREEDYNTQGYLAPYFNFLGSDSIEDVTFCYSDPDITSYISNTNFNTHYCVRLKVSYTGTVNGATQFDAGNVILPITITSSRGTSEIKWDSSADWVKQSWLNSWWETKTGTYSFNINRLQSTLSATVRLTNLLWYEGLDFNTWLNSNLSLIDTSGNNKFGFTLYCNKMNTLRDILYLNSSYIDIYSDTGSCPWTAPWGESSWGQPQLFLSRATSGVRLQLVGVYLKLPITINITNENIDDNNQAYDNYTSGDKVWYWSKFSIDASNNDRYWHQQKALIANSYSSAPLYSNMFAYNETSDNALKNMVFGWYTTYNSADQRDYHKFYILKTAKTTDTTGYFMGRIKKINH